MKHFVRLTKILGDESWVESIKRPLQGVVHLVATGGADAIDIDRYHITYHITCVSYYLSLLKLTRSVKSVPISGFTSGLMRSSKSPPDLDEQALEFFKFFRSTLNATVADQFNVSDINRIISHSRNMQRWVIGWRHRLGSMTSSFHF